ncbi:MAG TPA: addiction module protein [Thermoanaerobaculia bacterium]|nr:addiction module protein [Thermoanaerobaculia bacterium]
MSSFAEVEAQVRQLPPEDRARLAELLLESLVEVSSPSVEAAWDAEIRARVAAFERGEVELIPAEEVFARARKLAD